jgi:hypothetical protein
MRRTAALLALALCLSPSLAFAHFHRGGPHDPPPALRVEVSPARSGYIWTGGHYDYRQREYRWHPGRYDRERPGWAWRDGSWEHHEDHYDWHRGGWHR